MAKSAVLFKPPPPETQPNRFNFGAGIIPRADDRVKGILDGEEFSRIWDCAHCSAKEQIWLDNIGTFRCEFHTLELDPHTLVHPCCKSSNNGCRRRDHSPYKDPMYPNATINMAVHNGAPLFVCPVEESKKLVYHERAVARLADHPDMLYIVRIDPVN